MVATNATLLPVNPQLRTRTGAAANSLLCARSRRMQRSELRSRTTDTGKDIAPPYRSFDHLIRLSEKRGWHCEAKCLGRLKVDHQLVLGRRLHGKLARLGTL
jgi:hypothetical protein